MSWRPYNDIAMGWEQYNNRVEPNGPSPNPHSTPYSLGESNATRQVRNCPLSTWYNNSNIIHHPTHRYPPFSFHFLTTYSPVALSLTSLRIYLLLFPHRIITSPII